ncbi:MAG: RNA methyltransferase [Bacillota bacterium]
MIIKLESKNNQILKFVRSLSLRKFRDAEAAYTIEGRIVVSEALRQAKGPLYLVLADSFLAKTESKGLIEMAVERGVRIFQVTDTVFESLSKTKETQGVLMVLKKDEASWEEMNLNQQSFLVILDGIQDPGNLGTIIRTSAAAGVDGVVLTKGTVDLYNDKALRSIMGTSFKMKLKQDASHGEIIHNCQRLNLPLVVADSHGDMPYYCWNFMQGMALVIGSEAQGPSAKLSSSSKIKLVIPMPGGTESLNAGVAAGILLFERVRQTMTL